MLPPTSGNGHSIQYTPSFAAASLSSIAVASSKRQWQSTIRRASGPDGLAYRRDACEPSLHRTLTVTRRADVLRYFIERRELERHMAGVAGGACAVREAFRTALNGAPVDVGVDRYAVAPDAETLGQRAAMGLGVKIPQRLVESADDARLEDVPRGMPGRESARVFQRSFAQRRWD